MKTNFAPHISKMSNDEFTQFHTLNNYNYTRFILNQRLDFVSRLKPENVSAVLTLAHSFVESLDNLIDSFDSDEK